MAIANPNPSPTPTPTPIVVKPPPANARIPSVPEGTTPTNGTDYRGITPKKSELAVIADAVMELRSSTEFAAIFGKTMPSLAFIVQVLDAADQWSKMRVQTDAWDKYSRTQQGVAWINARLLMTKMKPVFEQAAAGNAEVATLFPSLALLLGAARAIAKRGATTRKVNAQREANGQAPTKGKVGKRRQRTAEIAAYKAANEPTAGTPPPGAPATTAPVPAPPAPVPGAPTTAAPQHATGSDGTSHA